MLQRPGVLLRPVVSMSTSGSPSGTAASPSNSTGVPPPAATAAARSVAATPSVIHTVRSRTVTGSPSGEAATTTGSRLSASSGTVMD